jgi:S-formylglutathione hydrolase FrmB
MRARVFAAQRFDGGPLEIEIPHPETPGVAYALFDHAQLMFSTLFGGNGGGNLFGVGTPIDGDGARVVLDTVRDSHPPTKRCDFEQIVVAAPEVAGSIGNDTERRLCVWLPPSYASGTRRYPVLYLLPGFGGDHATRLRGELGVHHVAAALAATEGRDTILVGIDSSTKLGSSYFEDSPTHGNWEAFALRVVAEIDKRYRTLPTPPSRGLLGKSTGGFNAISLAIRHSDVFGVVAASAPDALVFDRWLLDGASVDARWLKLTHIEHVAGGAGQMSSYAADWTPEASVARGFSFPYDPETGAIDQARLERWLDHSPDRLLRRHPEAKRLALFINVGRDDEFALHDPAAAFSALLTEANIPHTFMVSEGGHFETAPPLVPTAAAFALRTLAR